MSEWKEVRLEDVVELNPIEVIQKGKIVKKITMEKLQPFCKEISEYEFVEFNGGSKFRNDDTLMARITPCLENGKIAKVSILDENEIGFGSTEFIVFRAKKGLSNPDFLYYLIISSNIRNHAIKSMVGSSGRQRVQTNVLKKLLINLPDITTQQKIASILSSLDDKIELNNRINGNLEQQAQAIFKEWFVDNAKPEWKKGKLGEFVTIKRGGSPRPIQNYLSKSGLRWLKISDVTNLNTPFIFKITEHIRKEGLHKTVFLQAGSLVLSNSATPGIPKILSVDSCIHDGWLYFTESKFSNEFLYLLFRYARPNFLSKGNGSIFINLKTDIVKEYEFLIASDGI